MATVKKVDDVPSETLPSAEVGVNDATLQESVAPSEGDKPEHLEVAVEPSVSEEDKKAELQEAARDRELDDSGTKADLVGRINDHDAEGAHKPEVLYPHEEE